MIPTPGQPTKHSGIGAVNYYTGETEVIFPRRKRRREIAELLQGLLDKHPTGIPYVAWDNASTHQDDEVEAVVRGAAWRQFRREVTHCEVFETVKALLAASRHFFDRCNQNPDKVLSIVRIHPS
jgi:putative transposase